MYSPISESDDSSVMRCKTTEKRQKSRSSSRKRNENRKSNKSRHHHKHRHHHHSKESPSRRKTREDDIYAYRHRDDSRKEISPHRENSDRRSRRSELDSHNHRHKSSSRDKEKRNTFIGEMLRNTKTNKLISMREKSDFLDSLSRGAKRPSKEIEDGEISVESTDISYTPPIVSITPLIPMESFTPPMSPVEKCELPTQKIQIETNNNWIPLPEETESKPKKKSVLDLPMPPIVFDTNFRKRLPSNKSSSPETPELKPEHFKPKHRETHFNEICEHLNVNPVVISPNELESSCSESSQLHSKPRLRPVIIYREPLLEEYADRSFKSFDILQKIGEGTYGKVFKARDLQTENLVAMKFVRMEKEHEGFPITGLREVKILRGLQHPNIIQLREIVYDESKKNESGTYLVFEYMNHDLMGLLDNETMMFDEPTIYRIMRQILEGLNHCHKRNILHRDLKCSNILVNNSGVVKLADFGLGRQWICERPYTNNVISLWYRPIELLLGEEKYGTSVDMWSLGCIFGELFQRRAVFPFGTEIDMINAIFSVCGSPTKSSWPEVKLLPGYAALKPKMFRRVLRDTYTNVLPPLALDLFDKMLCLNPTKRITAEDALKSSWIDFMDKTKLLVSLKLPAERDCHEMNAKLRRKKKTVSQPQTEMSV